MAVGKDRLYFSFREDKIFDFRAVIQNTFLRLLAPSISQNRFLFIVQILWSAMWTISKQDHLPFPSRDSVTQWFWNKKLQMYSDI